MQIVLKNLGKRFNRHWVFRKLDYIFENGKAYAITGANGSGKSTLLQVLAGAIQLSEGAITMTTDGNLQQSVNFQTSDIKYQTSDILPEKHFQYLSIAAPYLELIEEFTLTEFLEFHFQFKNILPGQTISSIISAVGLTDAANKQIRNYSSGMKQRVKLAQAIFSDVPIVLLDEPTSNLDTKGIDLYKSLVNDYCQNRLLVICSNDENEISFCSERIDMADYKEVVGG